MRSLQERLDRALAHSITDLSRTRARQLILAGAAFVNGRRCKVASRLVGPADRLELKMVPQPEAIGAVPGSLTILYEDDSLLALDKPTSMPSAPTRTAAVGTALETLRAQLRERDGRNPRLWLVHRLDAATSGVLLFALRRPAAAALSAAFRDRRVDKEYLARVDGSVEEEDGRIELSLATRKGRAVVVAEGKAAVTEWRVVKRLPQGTGTWMVLRPRTGRLHQLRAHLAAIGHPVVGDRVYGGAPAPRLMLHASALRVDHPSSHIRLEIQAPPPPGWPS